MVRGFESVHARHADIEQHDFRPQPAGEQERFLAAGGDTGQFDFRQFLDQVREPLARERLVIDDEDSQDHMGWLPAGKRRVTTKRSGASNTSTCASPWNMSSSRWRTLSRPIR